MLKRWFEIIFGVLLIVLGVVMLVTPGPGTATIIAGLMFVSPQHGKRVIWWLNCLWKWLKAQWYRRIYGRSRVFKRKRK